ncbi:MAG TPA: hypothetical protein VD735_06660 [Candidatus Saccharimonadales bacterium]|nr:hypothetical protein [Candidatus Saccharimonadales bacterium]
MAEKASERRLAENEVVFRKYNEQVQEGFDVLNRTALEEGEPLYEYGQDAPLHFYCECSDENCRTRLLLSLHTYNQTHTKKDTFVIVCGHEVPDVERVIETQPTYCVIQKYKEPPASAEALQPTDVHNV